MRLLLSWNVMKLVVQADPDKKKAVKKVTEHPPPENAMAGENEQLKRFTSLCTEMTNLIGKQMELITELKGSQAPKPAWKRKGTAKKDVEGFKCGERGHYARECSAKKATAQDAGSSGNSSPPAGQ